VGLLIRIAMFLCREPETKPLCAPLRFAKLCSYLKEKYCKSHHLPLLPLLQGLDQAKYAIITLLFKISLEVE